MFEAMTNFLTLLRDVMAVWAVPGAALLCAFAGEWRAAARAGMPKPGIAERLRLLTPALVSLEMLVIAVRFSGTDSEWASHMIYLLFLAQLPLLLFLAARVRTYRSAANWLIAAQFWLAIATLVTASGGWHS